MVTSWGESSSSDQANRGLVAWRSMADESRNSEEKGGIATAHPLERPLGEENSKIAPQAPDRPDFGRHPGRRPISPLAQPVPRLFPPHRATASREADSGRIRRRTGVQCRA